MCDILRVMSVTQQHLVYVFQYKVIIYHKLRVISEQTRLEQQDFAWIELIVSLLMSLTLIE